MTRLLIRSPLPLLLSPPPKFKEESAVIESIKALKGTEIVPGKRLYFETQGPNGEDKAKKDSGAHGSDGNGQHFAK